MYQKSSCVKNTSAFLNLFCGRLSPPSPVMLHLSLSSLCVACRCFTEIKRAFSSSFITSPLSHLPVPTPLSLSRVLHIHRRGLVDSVSKPCFIGLRTYFFTNWDFSQIFSTYHTSRREALIQRWGGGGGASSTPFLRINGWRVRAAQRRRSLLPENCFVDCSIKGPVAGRRSVPKGKTSASYK